MLDNRSTITHYYARPRSRDKTIRLCFDVCFSIIKPSTLVFDVHTKHGTPAAQPPHARQAAHCIVAQCTRVVLFQLAQAGAPNPPPSIHHLSQGLAAPTTIPAYPPAWQGRQRQGVALLGCFDRQAGCTQAAAAPSPADPPRQPAPGNHGGYFPFIYVNAHTYVCLQLHTRLDHPHVVAMHAIHLTPTHVVLVLDAMLGGTLLAWVQARAAGRPRGALCMDEAEARHLFLVRGLNQCLINTYNCSTAHAASAAALPCSWRGAP